MYKILVLSLLINTLCAMAMESTIQKLKGLKIEDTSAVDIIPLWGQLNCEINREKKDAQKIITLLVTLKTLAAVDRPWLSESQHKDWKYILDHSADSFWGVHNMMHQKRNEQFQQLFDELDEYLYPINYQNLRLEVITWVKEKIQKSPWTLAWAEQLQLKKDDDTETQNLKLNAEEIRAKRLEILKGKKHKALAKLEIAKKTAPEKLPAFGTAKISGLWNIFKQDHITDSAQLKTLFACLGILMQIDFEWLTPKQRTAVEGLINQSEQLIWKNTIHSRLYYRWKLAAINWAEENINNDACENLAWYKNVLPPELRYGDMACPPVQYLKDKRLEALAAQKREALALLHDYSRREEKKSKAQSSSDDKECNIM